MAIEEYNNEQLKTKKIQNVEYSETSKKSKYHEYGKLNKVNKISRVASITVTVVGAGLILASIGGFTFGYKPTAVVETFNLNAGTDYIAYSVEISESKVETLIIQIHNQFMKEQQKITVGLNEGQFDGLKPGMQYKISILEKGVLVKSQNLFTQYA